MQVRIFSFGLAIRRVFFASEAKKKMFLLLKRMCVCLVLASLLTKTYRFWFCFEMCFIFSRDSQANP